MKTISIEDLKGKMEQQSNITLIEVLKEEEYKKGHIPRAINIPLAKIATEVNKRFGKKQEIIVYCSDYECTASKTAADKLEGFGFTNVYRYEGGKKEWKESGNPLET
jgi:rhodanese-related sulfurtransferase